MLGCCWRLVDFPRGCRSALSADLEASAAGGRVEPQATVCEGPDSPSVPLATASCFYARPTKPLNSVFLAFPPISERPFEPLPIFENEIRSGERLFLNSLPRLANLGSQPAHSDTLIRSYFYSCYNSFIVYIYMCIYVHANILQHESH